MMPSRLIEPEGKFRWTTGRLRPLLAHHLRHSWPTRWASQSNRLACVESDHKNKNRYYGPSEPNSY